MSEGRLRLRLEAQEHARVMRRTRRRLLPLEILNGTVVALAGEARCMHIRSPLAQDDFFCCCVLGGSRRLYFTGLEY